MTDAILVAQGVRKVYRTGDVEVEALRNLDLAIPQGEFLAVMGPSGSGKTTLLNCLSGLDEIDAGRVTVDGHSIHELSDRQRTRHRAETMGFIFQAFNLIGDLDVFENVELPLTYRGMPSSERRQRVKEALERVGMSHRMRHYPAQLSGGQQQRVAVARAVVGKPSILLADEPTGNLDSKNAEAVMALMDELHREGATICMVTHDPRWSRHATRTLHLFDGRVVEEQGSAEMERELEEMGFKDV